ncbi:MAG: agmatine deiminase [Gemmataceae bacterium]
MSAERETRGNAGAPETAARYSMPPEWWPHRATWLAWPHRTDDWPGKFEPIPWVMVEIVRVLQKSEPVHLLVQDAATEAQARHLLQRSGVSGHGLTFHRVPTDRAWTRDYGPTFVFCGETLTALKWQFTGWARYADYCLDESAGVEIAARSGCPTVYPTYRGRRVVLEGGGIDVNGLGDLLTTEEWLLSAEQVRNPGLTRADYEALFRTYLGVRQVHWLRHGLPGDDTHGHVDDLARFVGPHTVVACYEQDRQAPQHDLLAENLDILRSRSNVAGQPLEVVLLPLPERRVFDEYVLPASYANFYIANKAVLVPTYNCPQDRLALETLAQLFGDRTVVGIYCGDLILGLGAIHCLTQQQPAASHGRVALPSAAPA